MYDIKWIRDNTEAFDEGLGKRGIKPASAALMALDLRRRELQTELQELQKQRNTSAKEIGSAKAKGDEDAVQALMADVAGLKGQAQQLEDEEREAVVTLDRALAALPNRPADGVPVGKDETDNVELRNWGEIPTFSTPPKQHFELGEGLGLMDFDGAAKLSGARFVVLSGALARLERALGTFMLDMHTTESDYTEIAPPLMVREQAAFGTGNLPKFEEDLFRTRGDFWLIPTAEMPLTNLVGGEIVEAANLPYRYTACTPCFRAEAGSAGRDTRGMIRQHQFTKVELVSIAHPDQSEAEHDRMTACAEAVLQRLELPYRVMLLSTGDMGFSARKTYDLEVWLAGQGAYREISSCSNCGDFQARRMNARFRSEGERQTRFVHTLNGSGLAVGRTLVSVMENYQNADGSITVPTALRPYMGGLERIG